MKILLRDKSLSIMRDIYYYMIQASWRKLFITLILLFIKINIIFSILYYCGDNGLSISNPTWWDYFFFSVQTFSTIGYGAIAPISFYTNVLVTLEAILGLICSALITGIIFSKFSRPKASILFSTPILVTKHNGKDVLCFRVGNYRGNDLVSAKLTVTALLEETSDEGVYLRNMQELSLKRSESPFFSLTWLVFHYLDETSPLYKLVKNGKIDDKLITISALLVGHDGSFAQTIYAKHTYEPNAFIFNKHFADVITIEDSKKLSLDYSKFHDVV